MRAEHIKSNGERKEVMPKNGTDFSLKELQGFVGGYIEVVYLKHNKIMIVNEEGKLHALHVNDIATEMVFCNDIMVGCNDIIVGDVLVCDSDMVK